MVSTEPDEAKLGPQRSMDAANPPWWLIYAELSFAVAFGVLCLGGARELLRPSRVLWPAVAAGTAGIAMAAAGSLRAAIGTGLVAVGWWALLHSADAACRRSAADARGRLLAAALVVLGGAGWTAGLLGAFRAAQTERPVSGRTAEEVSGLPCRPRGLGLG